MADVNVAVILDLARLACKKIAGPPDEDEQWDQDSTMFHLERGALCGELEAIVALGQCCLQLHHHIVPDMELENRIHLKLKHFFAAEVAMVAIKGRLAHQRYMYDEEAWALMEE